MKVKKSIICKYISDYSIIDMTKTIDYSPQAGDVAVFQVVSIGKHSRLQCEDGKNRHILPGDNVMLAFGSRYATSQLEGYIPQYHLEEYHILGQGGVVGEIASFHSKFELKGPTIVKMVGYVSIEGNEVVANTKYLNGFKRKFNVNVKTPNVILSIGGAMDSGKTTTAGYLCKGLSRAGLNAAYVKLTGTVYSKDADFVEDCGANYVSDFSNCGFPSTYMENFDDLLDLYQTLLFDASGYNPDYIIVEIADGLLQRETNFLLKSAIMQNVTGVFYSDSSSTGILSGISLLGSMNIQPLALSGSFTASPLMVAEVLEYSEIPTLNLEALSNQNVINLLQPTMFALRPTIKENGSGEQLVTAVSA